jgi:hypothetical protein
MSKTQSMVRALVPAIAIAAAATCGGGATAASYTEDFDIGGSWTGWTQKNNSTLIGDYPDWAQGCLVTCPFSAYEGAPAGSPGEAGAFVSVDYQSTRDGPGPETIDNWLIMPKLTFNNGDVLTFYTRTEANSPYPDRLEVRFGAGAAPMPGSGLDPLGSFVDPALLTINPSLVDGGYPEVWTKQTVTIPFSGEGAIAFRYYIVDGGPGGSSSNVIGIDSLRITPAAPVPEPATYLMMALGLGAIGLRRMRAMRG